VVEEMDARTTVWFWAYSRAVLSVDPFVDCLDGGLAALPCASILRDRISHSPTPSISNLADLARLHPDRGTRARPTPAGVPVTIDVARDKVIASLISATSRRDIEDHVGGRCACITTPFKRV